MLITVPQSFQYNHMSQVYIYIYIYIYIYSSLYSIQIGTCLALTLMQPQYVNPPLASGDLDVVSESQNILIPLLHQV